jgi:sigma-B regulation protein RsbU (phosphoserine phosphatase)
MFRSITTRLIVWTLLLTGAVYILTIGLSNRFGRATAIAAAEREANNDTDAAVFAVDDVLDMVEESTASLARTVSELQLSREQIDRIVGRFSSDKRDIVARYDVIRAVDGDSEAPAWYQETRQRGTPDWTEPYKDPDLGNETVITRVVPLKDGNGEFAGAVAASLRLGFLSTVVREVHLGESGFALAVSRKGLLVAHSRRDLSDGVYDPLAELPPTLRAIVEPVVQRARSGEAAFVAVPLANGRVFRLTFRQVERTGWLLVTAYAEDELLADVSSLQRTQVVVAVAGLLILGIAIVLLSRRITGPLTALASSAGRLATGDLDGPLPEPKSSDEVGALTTAFHQMRDSLKTYIRNLREATAARERLEAEMRAARRIQADMLPAATAGGAAAPYELGAVLEPARSVGGDLYDHFERAGRVFFLIGDVSGKGVAAALFMARARTVFDTVATNGGEPGEMLSTMNRSLCRQNDAGMFVTAVCGVLDLQKRVVTFATAGHEPPVLVPPRGSPAVLATEGGRVLGLLEFGDYPTSTVTLEPGASLVMYTDGVSEARDPADGFFGLEGLMAAIGRLQPGVPATVMTESLLHEVKAFASTAPQSDDITILTLQVH